MNSQKMLDLMEDIICEVSADSTITYYNEFAGKMFSWSNTIKETKYVKDIFPNQIHYTHILSNNLIAPAFEKKEIVRMIFPSRIMGNRYWEFKAYPMLSENEGESVLMVAKDITETVQLADSMVDLMEDFICVVSEEGLIINYNHFARDILSWSRGSEVVRSVKDIFEGNVHYSDVFMNSLIKPCFERNEIVRMIFPFHIIGNKYWEFKSYPIVQEHKIEALLIVGKDISDTVQLADSKLSALRLQMNPHFIFNSLNAIQRYIHENRAEEAEKYLADYAHLIRTVLDNSQMLFISLEEELTFLHAYLSLEKKRMKDKFQYEIEIAEDIHTFKIDIPSMLIQPYLENAILHGIAAKSSGGLVSLHIQKTDDMLICIIEDNGIGILQSQQNKQHQRMSTIHATSITSQMLEILNRKIDDTITVSVRDKSMENKTETGTRVEITLPIRERF